jgi:diamine N-acetyltransferase
MKEELTAKINAADIAPELKMALNRFVDVVEQTLPRIPAGSRYRAAFLLNRLVTEATSEDPDILWWEAAIDLITKYVGDQGVDGQAVLEAAGQLITLLQRRLPPSGEVTLQEITAETVVGICLLSDTLTEPKKDHVAPNDFSLAQAHFNPHAWFRAIYAGKAPVGFVMMVDNDQEQEYFVWRFMIAGPYHGRGYGRQAIERLVEYVRTRPGARELLVSCTQGDGSPEGFYVKCGFEPTGDKMGNEVVLRLTL